MGTRDCPGQSVDPTAVAEMNLFLPRDYSAVCAGDGSVPPCVVFCRRKIIGEIESITTLTAAIASGMGVTVLPESAARSLRSGKRLDGADQYALDESVVTAEYVGERASVTAGTGGERDFAFAVSRPSLENRELLLVKVNLYSRKE